jgi:hypothetical protein
MRKTLMRMAAAGAAVVAAIGFAAAPANAAGPVDMPFGMAYGASTTTGSIHFTIGYSATVNGTVHAVSSTKKACAVGSNDPYITDVSCGGAANPGGENIPYSLPFRIPTPGGIQVVQIFLVDSLSNEPLAEVQCTRNGCIRVF